MICPADHQPCTGDHSQACAQRCERGFQPAVATKKPLPKATRRKKRDWTDVSDLSREQLIERLRAAELAMTFFAWSPAGDYHFTPVAAAQEAFVRWLELVPNHKPTSELDALEAEYAKVARDRRTATLALIERALRGSDVS